jgi:hypothetical protein
MTNISVTELWARDFEAFVAERCLDDREPFDWTYSEWATDLHQAFRAFTSDKRVADRLA